jgi:hypothetical protein
MARIVKKISVESLIQILSMDSHVKLFTWSDAGNHLIVIVRGVLNSAEFKRLFKEITATTRPLNECKVLVDLSDATCVLELSEVEGLLEQLPFDSWPEGNKLALVSGAERNDPYQIYLLRAGLASRGIAVRAYRDSKIAIDWLAGKI